MEIERVLFFLFFCKRFKWCAIRALSSDRALALVCAPLNHFFRKQIGVTPSVCGQKFQTALSHAARYVVLLWAPSSSSDGRCSSTKFHEKKKRAKTINSASNKFTNNQLRVSTDTDANAFDI